MGMSSSAALFKGPSNANDDPCALFTIKSRYVASFAKVLAIAVFVEVITDFKILCCDLFKVLFVLVPARCSTLLLKIFA